MVRSGSGLRKCVLVLLLVFLATGCGSTNTPSPTATPGVPRAENAIDISIDYMPLTEPYMPLVIEQFNRAYAEGRNPISGQPLAASERPIYITGKEGSSGTIMAGIVNAIIAPNNENVEKPTIFQPAVSHWLTLANYYSGRTLFNTEDIYPVALSPVVIAIWQSRLDAIRQTVGYDEIGWEELLRILNSPNGWQDYGITTGRRSVYYGHTDPYISSTGLSTLITEFYASARQADLTERVLTLETVNLPEIQQGVRDIESLIRHYSSRTTEFKFYIAQGPEYLDFVALPENDLIYINQGKTGQKPPEPLVALYPKEGTFWHEHPFGIVNAEWVTPEQHDAAEVFTQFVLSPTIQSMIMSYGFRPANPDVPLSDPIVAENGVDVQGPDTTLDVPPAEVVAAIQQSWGYVKKQADILLLFDISGSMNEANKLQQAKQAALAFLDNMQPGNRVGLTVFSGSVQELVPLTEFEAAETQLRAAIEGLNAEGGTALYSALRDTVLHLATDQESDRIRAIVLLSDGKNSTDDGVVLNDVVQTVNANMNELSPIIVVPVAYGADADAQALNSIARASRTQVQPGDPETITRVLNVIASYF